MGGAGGGQYGAIGTGGVRGREGAVVAELQGYIGPGQRSGLRLGPGQGPGLGLGCEHTQELLPVSIGQAQWHQERPLLLAVHMPRARKCLLGTPRRS